MISVTSVVTRFKGVGPHVMTSPFLGIRKPAFTRSHLALACLFCSAITARVTISLALANLPTLAI
jgi:hypothetical protein